MRALVLYESMFGNTHEVAEAIARGLRSEMDADVYPVSQAPDADVVAADLLVVGAPTHVHGLPRASTRAGAAEQAAAPDSTLELEPDADHPGVREWLGGLDRLDKPFAAFDTRIDVSAVLSGRASKGISKRMRKVHATEIADPESFLVDKQSVLLPGEEARAVGWGMRLAKSVAQTVS